MKTRTFDTTVIGGIPVTIGYEIEPVDREVGIFAPYVSDWWITEINGRKVHKPSQAEWLMNRVARKKGEDERITEACMEDYNEGEPDV